MNKASSFPRRRESSKAQRLGPRFPLGMRSAIRGGDVNEDLSFPRRRESREARRLGPRFPFGMRSAIRGGDTVLSRDFLA